jgi:hypothetical protein
MFRVLVWNLLQHGHENDDQTWQKFDSQNDRLWSGAGNCYHRSGPKSDPAIVKGKPMNLLGNIQSRPLPLAQLMGMTFTHAEPDKVIARMVVRPDLCTLGHTIHGGSAMALPTRQAARRHS